MIFRALKPEEIEVKPEIEGNKVCLLLHKDARVDQNMLDEKVGPMNWQRDHKIVGTTFCGGIGIYDSKKNCWVWKWDAGSPQLQEADKSQASDSYKRAATNWGIGRELYTAKPLSLFINGEELKNFTPSDGKKRGFIEDKFRVLNINTVEEPSDETKIRKYIQSIQIGVYEKGASSPYKIFEFKRDENPKVEAVAVANPNNRIEQKEESLKKEIKRLDLCGLSRTEVLRIGRLKNRTIESLITVDKEGKERFIPDFLYLLKWTKNTVTSYQDAKTQEQYVKLCKLAKLYV